MSRTSRCDLRASFPIELSVKYEITVPRRATGEGRTVTLGSDVVRFLSDRNLEIGIKVQLEVAWPALLPDGTGLNLWIYGRVARSSYLEVEVRVSSYEFRTRRRMQAAVAATANGAKPALVRVARAGQ